MASVYEWFLKSLLVTRNSVPIQSLWSVYIEPPPAYGKIFSRIGDFESGWKVDAGKDLLGSSNQRFGLIFAQGVKIPGEGMNYGRTGPENTGILRGLIGEGRKDLEALSISFLETNTSFTDFVLRPWAVMVSHQSLKADKLKTTITVKQYAKSGPGSAFTDNPRKIIKFFEAAPVSINTEEYDYGQDKLVRRQAEFAYTRYEISSGSSSKGGGLTGGFSGGSQAGFSGS